jgi:hypothetical protein
MLEIGIEVHATSSEAISARHNEQIDREKTVLTALAQNPATQPVLTTQAAIIPASTGNHDISAD